MPINDAKLQQQATAPKRSKPPTSNLPALAKVEQSHAMAETKVSMAARAALYDQLADLEIQHIDYCETQKNAKVQAHIESKGGADFLQPLELTALMGEFMPAIAPVQRASAV